MAAINKSLKIDAERCLGCGTCVEAAESGAVYIHNGRACARGLHREAAAVDGAAFSPFVEHSYQRDKLGNELAEVVRLAAAFMHYFQQGVHLDDVFRLGVAATGAQFAFEPSYFVSHFIQRVEDASASHIRGGFSLGMEVESVHFLSHVEGENLKFVAEEGDFIFCAHAARPPANAV